MIKTIITTSLVLSSFSALIAKEYRLDKKGLNLPVGTKLTTKNAMNCDNIKVDIESPQGPMLMKGIMDTNATDSKQALTKNSYRYLLSNSIDNSVMKMNGQALPKQPKKKPLLNTPIIYTFENGNWTGKAEKGELTPEQQKKVDRATTEMNKPLSLFTYIPKSVGDYWKVDLTKVNSAFLGAGDDSLKKGEATITFLAVEKFNGHECAKLSVEFSQSGKEGERGPDMTMKGKAIVHRSLTLFNNLNVTADITLEMSMNQGLIKMKGGGTGKASRKTTITK